MNFDWNREIKEFIDDQLVKSVETVEDKGPLHRIFRVRTLENQEFDLDCHYKKGIQVVKFPFGFPHHEALKSKRFESFEQVFNKISPNYQVILTIMLVYV